MSKYLVNRFRNVTVALNTPFDSCGAVSPDAIRNFVQHQYEKGIRALYVCGNTGEGFLLPLDERKFVLETVMKSVPADITVIAHVGAAATREAVELAAHTEQTGAHGTSVIPCVYYRS